LGVHGEQIQEDDELSEPSVKTCLDTISKMLKEDPFADIEKERHVLAAALQEAERKEQALFEQYQARHRVINPDITRYNAPLVAYELYRYVDEIGIARLHYCRKMPIKVIAEGLGCTYGRGATALDDFRRSLSRLYLTIEEALALTDGELLPKFFPLPGNRLELFLLGKQIAGIKWIEVQHD